MSHETEQEQGESKREGGKKRSPLSEIPYKGIPSNVHPKDVLKPPAVLPELPSPLKTIYVTMRNMNKDRFGDRYGVIPESDCAPEHNALEVGFKMSF